MHERRVRTAVIGNSFATKVQVPGLAWAGGAEVIGLAGRNMEKAQKTAQELGIPKATDDWRALLELKPDLVLISTPVDLHCEMVLAALEAGAAVLCEKPFALNLAQAQAMQKAAAGRQAWIDHELRWSPYLRELRQRVRAGAVGQPWLATFDLFVPPGPGRAKRWCWWFDAERGGGVLGALGSHMIDTLRWILGDVEQVRASLLPLTQHRLDAEGQSHPVTADELALVELRHASGARSQLRSSTVLHQDQFFRLQVEGAAGCLLLTGEDDLAFAVEGGDLEPLAVQAEYPTCREMGMPEYGPFGRSFPLFARDLVRAVADESELSEAADFSAGLAVQAVLDAARKSSSSHGGWVSCR